MFGYHDLCHTGVRVLQYRVSNNRCFTRALNNCACLRALPPFLLALSPSLLLMARRRVLRPAFGQAQLLGRAADRRVQGARVRRRFTCAGLRSGLRLHRRSGEHPRLRATTPLPAYRDRSRCHRASVQRSSVQVQSPGTRGADGLPRDQRASPSVCGPSAVGLVRGAGGVAEAIPRQPRHPRGSTVLPKAGPVLGPQHV